MNITIPQEDLNRLRKKFNNTSFEEKIDNILEAASAELEAGVVENIKKKEINNTGRLSQSIFSRKIGNLMYEVGTNVNYAPFVEYGTQPHTPPFKPINQWVKQKLGFSGKKGENVAWAIISKISKKGTRARNYFSDAYEDFNFKSIIKKAERSWLE